MIALTDEQTKQILQAQALMCAEVAMEVIVSKSIPRESSIAKEIYRAIIECGPKLDDYSIKETIQEVN